LLVRYFTAFGNNERDEIRVRHAHIFSLSAGIAAGGVRVAEVGADLAVLVGVIALALKLMLAEPAFAAAYIERDDDAVALLNLRNGRTGLFHDAERLVADDIIMRHIRDHAVNQVKIRTADGGCRQPNNDVIRLLDARIRNLLDDDVLHALISDGFHRASDASFMQMMVGCPSIGRLYVQMMRKGCVMRQRRYR